MRTHHNTRHPLRRIGLSIFTAVTAAATVFGLAACSTGEENSTNQGNNSSSANGKPALTITDVAGREVSFTTQPSRILLGEGRALFATAILNKEDPAHNIVGIGNDLHSAAPSFEKELTAARPDIASLPTIGTISSGDVTVENLLSYKPDAIVLTLDHKKAAEESGLLEKIDKAGLTYVFTDFRQKPLENTTKSMTVFGQLLGKQDKAEEFNKLYKSKVDDITNRAKAASTKPATFLWRAAGIFDCCATWNNANLGELINAAGGKNLGDDLVDTEAGSLTPEKVLEIQPEHIIATGGAWAKDPKKPEQVPHVELGYTAQEDIATRTLEGILGIPGFQALQAPKQGKLHAVYHQFYDSPLNVFALEQIATWLQPDIFKDLNPQKDFMDFHAQWMPFNLKGTFFTTMPAQR